MFTDLMIWQNFVKFSNLGKLAKHIGASHIDGFHDFGKCDEFGKILSNCQVYAN